MTLEPASVAGERQRDSESREFAEPEPARRTSEGKLRG
jgi:hypothetical protein